MSEQTETLEGVETQVGEIEEVSDVDETPSLAQRIEEKKAQTKQRIEDTEKTFLESDFYKEKIVVAFAGHRPDKIYQRLAKRISNDYLAKNKDKIAYVVTGGARGFDIEILKHCLKLGIPYKIRLPFEENKRHLSQALIEGADEITWEKKKYSSSKDKQHYHGRNAKIVKEADEVHVYLRKNDGGTISTINIAKETTNKIIFNWYHLSYMQVPNGMTQEVWTGHRLHYFKEILNRLASL